MISKTRGMFPVQHRTWGGMIPGSSTGPRLQVCMRGISQVAVCTRDVEVFIHTHSMASPNNNNKRPQTGLLLTETSCGAGRWC